MKLKLFLFVFTFSSFITTTFSQNVGVGTTTPQAKLHVNDSVNVNTVLLLTNYNGSFINTASIALKNSSYDDKALQFFNSNPQAFSNTRQYTFLDASANQLVSILNDGKVAIGPNTPLNRLDVNGNISIGNLYHGSFSAPSNGAIIQGSVGIGTPTPVNKLDVGGGAVIGSNYAGYRVAPSNGLLLEGRMGIGVHTPQNFLDIIGNAVIGGQYAGTTAAPQNGLLVGGNVGIGTSNVLNALDVNGRATISLGLGVAGVSIPTNGLDVKANAAIGYDYAGFPAPASGLIVQGFAGFGTNFPKNALDVKGAVVIGGSYGGGVTSPANGLLVQGNMGLGITTPQNKLDVNGSVVIGGLYAGVSSGPVQGLLVEGSVGIGVSNPINKLQVSGTASFTGNTGVGVVSPINKLDVAGGSIIGSSYAGILTAPANGLLVEGKTGLGTITPKNQLDVNGAIVIGNSYAGVTTSPANGLLIQGNVGIGVTTPQNKLDVEGGAVIGSSFSGTNAAPVNGLLVEGNLGIGVTTPQNKLDIEGGAVVGTSYSGSTLAPSNGLLVQGNVGIGTTTPNGSLDVGNKVIVSAADGKISMEGTKNLTYGLEWYYSGDDRYGIAQAASGNLALYPSTPFSTSAISFNLAGNGTLTELARFNHSGNLGIGVTTPVNKLDVEGAVAIGASYSGASTAPANGMIVQGRVGIGTNNPSVPLEVVGTVNYNVGTYQYMNQSGSGFFTSSSIPVSIRASGVVVASEIEANSDIRIKRNINTSSSQNDLSTLLKIRVTDYELQDSVYFGNGKIKGFIAQELEKIMPQAVHTNTDFVPDIYCLSTSTEYNEKEKTLKIVLCKPHELKVGDKVKVFAGDGMQEQYVSAINSNKEFTISNWVINQAGMNPISKVFVWGKQVNDFHTVDYNQVFSLGISAIQQLAKENEELKLKTDSLQQQIDELKKMIQQSNK